MANASHHHSIGRPHVLSRKDMVGLFAALKRLMAEDEEKMVSDYSAVHNHVPVAAVLLKDGWEVLDGRHSMPMVLEGDPPAFRHYFPSSDYLLSHPVSLQPGEAEIVAQLENCLALS